MQTPEVSDFALSKTGSAAAFSPPLAVIDRVEECFIVWHVDIGPGPRLSRLCGAWAVAADQIATIRNLVHNYSVAYPVGTVVLPQGITSTIVVDVNATTQAVRVEIAKADQHFTEHEATVKHRLMRPSWPTVYQPGTRAAATPTTDPIVLPTLTLAIGLADLADAWAEFEALRLARDYLIPLVGPTARPLPLEKIR